MGTGEKETHKNDVTKEKSISNWEKQENATSQLKAKWTKAQPHFEESNRISLTLNFDFDTRQFPTVSNIKSEYVKRRIRYQAKITWGPDYVNVENKPLQKDQLSIAIKTAHICVVLSAQIFNTQFWHEATKKKLLHCSKTSITQI